MKKIIALIGAMLIALSLSMTVANAATKTDECVPKDAYAETVVDHEAYDETVTYAQHYSLKGNSGIEKDETPVFPADYWQANTDKEPHLNNPNVTWVGTVGSGLHYTSNESNGKRDWFYLGETTETVHHDAVTHVVEHPAVTCNPDTPPTITPTPTTELGPVPTIKPKKKDVVVPTVVHAGL
jgi:hypothetical protein